MKTAYSCLTLRYVHDVVTGEFANVGVVVYAPAGRFLEARFTSSYERLNSMFLKIDHAHFRSLMRYLANSFEELAAEVRDGFMVPPLDALGELARKILPADDSSLQWSSPGGGLSEDLSRTVEELYVRLVERYVRGQEQQSRSDEEIAKPFKARLEQRRVADRVQPKVITTPDYQYEFRFARQNGIWHVYEPVSFDLVDPNSIAEKAVRWLGREKELRDSPDRFKIYFLLGEPRQGEARKAFERAMHLLKKIDGTELVREKDVEGFADAVAREIAEHDRETVGREERPGE
ncbi:MAG TPA: DUF3037 domain-containing protein [Chthoniobacter sp.]|jgi:hypothetical protein